MKLAALAISAALLGVLGTAPANAAPVSSAIKQAATIQDGQIHQVQYGQRKFNKKRGYRKGYRQGFRAGHRYNNPPKGWRRYSARPYGWQTRGCVIVGPLWFCP